jgi:hypothetical protein
MRSSKRLLIALAFLLVFALGASSVMATGYIRGYVKPSGDGGSCLDINTTSPNCVSDDGTTLLNGVTGAFDKYQIIGVTGITAGIEVDFTFTGPVTTSMTPVNVDGTAYSPFAVLVCGYDGNPVKPGIYDSNHQKEDSKCTVLGDPFNSSQFMNPKTLIQEVPCATANMVCLTFSGAGLPSTWFFAEDLTTGPPLAATPEPATLSLLAVGLIGLGVLLRKHAT